MELKDILLEYGGQQGIGKLALDNNGICRLTINESLLSVAPAYEEAYPEVFTVPKNQSWSTAILRRFSRWRLFAIPNLPKSM